MRELIYLHAVLNCEWERVSVLDKNPASTATDKLFCTEPTGFAQVYTQRAAGPAAHSSQVRANATVAAQRLD
jgi:hypothetical protein